MKKLALFAKGNVDVADSLHSCRIGGKLLWNGINEVLRVTHPEYSARLKHETFNRSDALLRAHGTVPEELSSRNIPFGAYPLATQFSQTIFTTKADAIILSIQGDITSRLARHRQKGFLFHPGEIEEYSAEDRAWFKSECETMPKIDVATSMTSLTAIIERIRQQSEAPILIYNLSPITPGDHIHCYQGFDEVYSTRIRRFSLGLIELSDQTGISIIDVETLMARKGAEALKLDMVHLLPEGYRLVAEEVVRVLADVGVLE